jgi:hypothetical protein
MNITQFPTYATLPNTAMTPLDILADVALHGTAFQTMSPSEHIAQILQTISALNMVSTAITLLEEVGSRQSSVHLYVTDPKKSSPLTTKRAREDDTTTDNKHAKTTNNKHEKTIPCIVCAQMFSQKVNMEEHVRSFHNKEKHPCPICKKDLSSRSNLSAHVKKTHAAEDKYCALKRCDVCNLSMRGDLLRHSLTKKHLAAVAKAQPTTTQKCADDAKEDGV